MLKDVPAPVCGCCGAALATCQVPAGSGPLAGRPACAECLAACTPERAHPPSSAVRVARRLDAPELTLLGPADALEALTSALFEADPDEHFAATSAVPCSEGGARVSVWGRCASSRQAQVLIEAVRRAAEACSVDLVIDAAARAGMRGAA